MLREKIDKQKLAENNLMNEIPSSYVSPNSIDAWRHQRMMDTIIEIINYSKDQQINNYPSSWLTLGDGRFGNNANYLIKKGLKNVLASSITEKNLKYAKENKYIKDYRIENAEKLNFNDQSVDFIFCKESYHHFPRPNLALYEMIRVFKQAIILIEPFDDKKIFNFIKKFIKFVIRGKGEAELIFEPSGNFLYKISTYEFKKMLSALGGYNFAIKGINDFYVKKFSKQKINELNFEQIVTKLGISIQNILCRCKLLGYGLGTLIIYKRDNINLENILKKSGFNIFDIPQFEK